MKKTWIIYEIINPDNQHYVGCTSNLNNRKRAYKNKKDKHGIISESFRVFGYENHLFNILGEVYGSKDDACSLEMFWIRTKMCNVKKYPFNNGLNLTDGGQGQPKGGRLTKEHCRKLSEAHKGQISTQRCPISIYKDGVLINTYASVVEAAIKNDLCKQIISKCINGKKEVYRGFTFKKNVCLPK